MSEPLSTSYPVLPLRDIVVFPHMIVPLFVGREKSVRALVEVMADDKQILLSSQIDPSVDDPGTDAIYRVGVLANVLQLLKLPDGTVKVLVEGKARVKITDFVSNPSFFEAHAVTLDETPGDKPSVDALIRAVAEEAGVPVIEDPPLARALYAAVERKAYIDGFYLGHAQPIGSHATPNDGEPSCLDSWSCLPG